MYLFFINAGKFFELGIYFSDTLLYDKPEQSRRPRVKCCQNGELSGRRRTLSATSFPHPLPHKGYPPLWKAILGWVRGLPVLRCPYPKGVSKKPLPLCLVHKGIFVFWKCPQKKGGIIYGKNPKKHNPVPPSLL